MQSTNALSIAPDARDWLANSRQPRILHVFEQACNLIDERKEVLSIVSTQIGNGPFNLVVENEILFTEHLDAKSPITIYDHQLILGELDIDTKQARQWSAHPDWGMLHQNKDKILPQLASSISHQPGIPNSRLSAFSCAVANADLSSSLSTAKKLAGLGNGLTPAGDDFILGALHAAWIVHPHETARALAKEISNVAAPLTTSLSAAWLKSAGKGEAGIMWHEFFDALISAGTLQIQEAMNRILAVGETSGADALAGFGRVCAHWTERASTKFH